MYKLVYYPDARLQVPTKPVVEFNDELKNICANMIATMVESKGVGLSANQVGIDKSIFVMQTKKKELIEFINPVIVEMNGHALLEEGCLSAPTIYVPVSRATEVVVKAQRLDGSEVTVVAEGIEAVIMQHEIDHLNGIFFFEKTNSKFRKWATKQLKKVLEKL